MHTAPNGMNLRRSIGKPSSNFEKVRRYLYAMGPSTKAAIVRDVFGRTDVEPRGWNCYLFAVAADRGYFKKVRKGRQVLWSLA